MIRCADKRRSWRGGGSCVRPLVNIVEANIVFGSWNSGLRKVRLQHLLGHLIHHHSSSGGARESKGDYSPNLKSYPPTSPPHLPLASSGQGLKHKKTDLRKEKPKKGHHLFWRIKSDWLLRKWAKNGNQIHSTLLAPRLFSSWLLAPPPLFYSWRRHCIRGLFCW